MNHVLRTIGACVVALSIGLASIGTLRSEELTRVFIFAGQSNMVGADADAKHIDDYPDFRGAGEPQNEILYSYTLGNGDEASKGWVPLKPLRSFGPEVTFGRSVKRNAPFPIAIIKSAVGGTTVAFDWNPDAPEKGRKLYPRTLQLIRDSLAELDRRGVRYQLEAVMWHQGENDMLDRNLYKQYADGLTKLIAQLRVDLKTPDLDWYIAEVSEKGIWGMDHRSNLGILRQQQELVLKSDKHLHWVPTSHLAFEVMGSGQPHYHFGTQGQLQMGEAFAAKYLSDKGLVQSPSEPAPKITLPVALNRPMHLFVLAGQRNMEGEDSFVSEIAKQPGYEFLVREQKDVAFRYSLGGGVKVCSEWASLGPTSFLGNFGPELSFGAKLRTSVEPSDGVAIAKFTHSGAQGPDWFPQGSEESHRNLYPKFIAFIQSAQEDLKQHGLECKLEGVLWHVGENDTFFGPYAQNNSKWLKQLIAQVRMDLKQPDLQWYISEQHPKAPWGNIDKVNSDIRQLSENDPGVTVIRTAELPHGRHHFETKGTILLGEEMAQAYLKTRTK